MDKPPGKAESTDGSSIKPVSSLRSHFENMLNRQSPPTPDPPRPANPRQSLGNIFDGHDEARARSDGRMSLDLPRPNAGLRSTSPKGGLYAPSRTPETRGASLDTNRSRPISMYQLSPRSSPPRSPTRTPPVVTVNPPKSPNTFPEPDIKSPTPTSAPKPPQSSPFGRSGSPHGSGSRHMRVQSKPATPAIEALQAPFLQSGITSTPSPDPSKQAFASPDREYNGRSPSVASSAGGPPPINRAGKPKIPSKPASVAGASVAGTSVSGASGRASLAVESGAAPTEERLSPFSTPPSSDEGGVHSPPSRSNAQNSAPPSVPVAQRSSYFQQTPAARPVEVQEPPKLPSQRPFQPPADVSAGEASDSLDERPSLPPRRGGDIRKSKPPPPDPPPARRSMDTSRAAVLDAARAAAASEPTPKLPKRSSTIGPTKTSAANGSSQPEPSRPAARPIPATRQAPSQRYSAVYRDDSDDIEQSSDKATAILSEYPDSSQANRRPPTFRQRPREIALGYDTKLFAVCGEIVCSSGYLTRAWNIVTGEMLLNTALAESTKMTAMAFRPSTDVENEGAMVWLGSEKGELFELDISSGAVIAEKRNAHSAKITKIYRYAAEMWTIDEDGKVNIWPPDETGSPILQQTPSSFRIPKNHTCSIVVGNKLWVANGKDIRIFQRSPDHLGFVPVLSQTLSAPNAGEVTAAAMIPSQPERIYFGHNDGKVSVYSRKDYSCLGVVSVSVYKISCLAGAGDYLWAGYNTGMIYVYDTTRTPWQVKKDWHAHSNGNPVGAIQVDRSSLWKLDRLQVASLGTDSVIRIWDGMLKDDWLEQDMEEHDVEFCDFRQVSATIMTWNAGASKPTSLNGRFEEQEGSFFRDLLRPDGPSDILVFGFQELVDLEDKKVTAKSFFKSSKKKDASDQEHMSRQYRAWRDHLARCIEEYLPGERYYLLHTANMVGLFTCVFVKESERMRIRDMSAAEIKLGMGGLHGNKGALVVRFVLDDSSVCFVNCHLAAGQSQTAHRNNDVATIMETSALPAQQDLGARADVFVGGGDGSMILDHEICILNGDLNYRIDSMTRDAVIRHVREGNLTRLLENDQLLRTKKRNPGFRLRAFRESPITFAPTYKYDVGTDRYDTSEKKRSPAWCDRLLYRGRGRIKQLEYRRHEVRVSDHRPVSGRFDIRVKTINAKRRAIVWEQSEHRFEELKQRLATDIKLDYMINVFGLSTKDAMKLLKL